MRFMKFMIQEHGPRAGPRNWNPFEKQARTLVGPEVLNRHYQIPFTKREEFEAAWPHFLKVKSKGAPTGSERTLGKIHNIGIAL
jgi:hypothetical protein